MHTVNPMNILKLLETEYGQHFQPSDSPSAADKLLKKFVKEFLDIHHSQAGCPVLPTEELTNTTTFDEFEKSITETNLLNGYTEDDFDATPDDRLTNYEPPSNETEPSSRGLFFPRIQIPKVPFDQAADVDCKKRAVIFCSEPVTEKRRGLSCMQKRFKKLAAGGSRIDKLKAMGKQFFLSKQKPHVVKDMDIQRWAFTTNHDVGLAGFKASSWWVAKCKRYFGICDGKTTKFVTEKYLEEEPEMEKRADECVAIVKSRIQAYGLDCL
ncbi:hypothetical protein RvY_03603 [Ramazzottius varieornatus]|uniref:HTH CENPB-type domain-containing protein n=1 Tax=Ramazzottius varieornatus TaxID=947166 RepID=A0A1D1UPF9_RAMVA|nr:hypothetical protein RvY_03603 [Ramazzottius varieornatus]